MKNKFSEQLSLALDRHKESTQQQVADGDRNEFYEMINS